jgi:hypothetical protein
MFVSSSVCRIPFRIFCSGGLVIIYYFISVYHWKFFIPPSVLNDSCAGWSILELKLFSFSAQNTYSMPFLLLSFCWKICCHFDATTFTYYLTFLSYSFQYSFFVLCVNCFNYNIICWREIFIIFLP